jgi:hypothetical protein
MLVFGFIYVLFGGHFSIFFLRSAMDASVVKVAPMAWGFLQKENGGVQ